MIIKNTIITYAVRCDAPGCVAQSHAQQDDGKSGRPEAQALADARFAGFAVAGDVHLCPRHKGVSAVEVADERKRRRENDAEADCG